MLNPRPIIVFEQDRAVLASLQFALALEGYRVVDGESRATDPAGAACLIIEQRRHADTGLRLLDRLRARGLRAPAILLATNPPAATKSQAIEAGAILVEKPLLGDRLTQVLHHLCDTQVAA
ncbi:histidine kinase [Croceibacterium ferulae]|uniref:histidine kinase n=1 Tax=Croceibacterium ferulae TaxID=1854641 RepID=UPI000EB2F1E6|nr:histidine kinase [Croceibacterium ferulae]